MSKHILNIITLSRTKYVFEISKPTLSMLQVLQFGNKVLKTFRFLKYVILKKILRFKQCVTNP